MGAWRPQDKPTLVNGSEIPVLCTFCRTSQNAPGDLKLACGRWKAPSKDSKAHVPLFNLLTVGLDPRWSLVCFLLQGMLRRNAVDLNAVKGLISLKASRCR